MARLLQQDHARAARSPSARAAGDRRILTRPRGTRPSSTPTTSLPRPEDRPTLTVSYLLWTPLTESVKCGLEKEDNSAPAKQDFAAFAKDFIDDKLADAVLYGGAYREKVIRPSVQAALCLVASPDHKTCAPSGYRDPTVIITHSLGGYMLMDAIADELRGADCQSKSGGGAAEKILENTPVIYMMANQLALLDLSTLHRDPDIAKAQDSGERARHESFRPVLDPGAESEGAVPKRSLPARTKRSP